MSIYRYAGATLMLAGLIDKANRDAHKWAGKAAYCGICRSSFRVVMGRWLKRQ